MVAAEVRPTVLAKQLRLGAVVPAGNHTSRVTPVAASRKLCPVMEVVMAGFSHATTQRAPTLSSSDSVGALDEGLLSPTSLFPGGEREASEGCRGGD